MSGSSSSSAGASHPRPGAFLPHELRTVILTMVGVLMFAADSTIVILALPTLGRELASPLGTIIWAVLVYLLVTTILTTQAGRLGDLLGRDRVYNGGFAVFTIGSALCGLAPNAEFLIAARALQAIGGAVIFANGAAVVSDSVAPERRARAFGYFVSGWAAGAIIGILLGGVITTTIGWRYIFFINVPIGLIAVPLGITTIPKTPPRHAKLDLPGFAVLSAGLAMICYGAIEVAANGADALYAGLVVVGLLLLPVFAAIELRTAQPMIDVRALRQRFLGFSLLAAFVQALGYLSVLFLLTMYLQGLRDLSPLDASLLLVPGYLVGAFFGPFVGRQIGQYGARPLATLGIVVTACAVLAYSQLSTTTWLGVIPIISLATGFGSGMFFPSNTAAVMSQATPRTFGSISGLQGTLQNMGMLLSFVLTLTIAAASVPRYVAFEVFLGTTNLVGGIGSQFLLGIHAALYGAVLLLIAAALISWARGVPPSPAAPPPAAAPSVGA
jgi:EmrB/QacA subfamily drug resistance transporter